MRQAAIERENEQIRRRLARWATRPEAGPPAGLGSTSMSSFSSVSTRSPGRSKSFSGHRQRRHATSRRLAQDKAPSVRRGPQRWVPASPSPVAVQNTMLPVVLPALSAPTSPSPLSQGPQPDRRASAVLSVQQLKDLLGRRDWHVSCRPPEAR